MLRPAPFQFTTFSDKQKQLLTWWLPESPVFDKDMIIAAGSIRSGKTLPMGLSFVLWAMTTFRNQNFGMAGKTIGALRRNVIILLKVLLKSRGYKVIDRRGDIHYLEIIKGDVTNYFFLFGGYNERSQDLIQGVTLAGMYFDEVAIMPESFVNQAVGRCSVEGSRFWLNCNPEGPYHWFKTGWIDNLDEKNAYYLKFELDDNLSLSEKVKARYRRLFSGVFYQRYILGLWVLAEGIIYSMFDDEENVFDEEPPNLRYKARRYAAVDYGTSNPMVFLDIWDDDDTIYQTREYYYSGKTEGIQKTDSAYADDFEAFFGPSDAAEAPIEVIMDPSAASFKAELRNRGYRVKDAKNDVADGIRMMSSIIGLRMYKVHRSCKYTIMEFKSYVLDEKAALRGVEQPLKQQDHCLDAARYLIFTKIRNWRLQKAA
jgi:PBSX family phage terminase large subunit